MAKIRVHASVLSADFGRLAEEVERADQAGADGFHVDVMDGQFVPNITIGPSVVRAIRRATQRPLQVHLMIVEPERYLSAFADAGADGICVHLESSAHIARALQQIRALGRQAGVALNPQTPHEAVRYLLELCDFLVVMSVNPGFGGQEFMPGVLPKVQAIRELIEASGRNVDIEMDGGIQAGTARRVVEAGARVLVAGAAIYTKPDYGAAIRALREDAMAGLGTDFGEG